MDARYDIRAEKRAMLSELMAVFRCTAGSIGRLVVDEDRVVALGGIAIGAAPFVASREASQGRPIDGFRMDLDAVWPFNELTLVTAEGVPAKLRATMWDGIGLRDALAMNIASGDAFVGHVAVFRTHDDPPFSSDEVSLARRSSTSFVRQYTNLIAAADVTPLAVGSFVLAPNGELRSSTTDLVDAGRGALARCVREFLAGERFHLSLWGDWLIEQKRLDTSEGGTDVLVNVRRVRRGRVPPIMRLSPWKRRIAAYAARGATIPEIAATLERQPETIRAHLKQIYEALGIASRVELSELCRTLWVDLDPMEDSGTRQSPKDA